jgi:hypothetical protein
MNQEWDVEEIKDKFGGTEADFNIMEVKEEKTLIPPTDNVLAKIREVKVISHVKESLEEKKWKMILIKFQLVDGIEIAGESKYKGAIVSSKLLCYYADSSKYNYDKLFYKKQQFLVGLASVCKATGQGVPIKREGANDEDITDWAERITGNEILISIKQSPKQAFDSTLGEYVNTDEIENFATNFKPLSQDMLV